MLRAAAAAPRLAAAGRAVLAPSARVSSGPLQLPQLRLVCSASVPAANVARKQLVQLMEQQAKEIRAAGTWKHEHVRCSGLPRRFCALGRPACCVGLRHLSSC